MFSLNGGDGMKGTVYILEDDLSICGLIKVALEMNGLDFKGFATVKSFLDGVAESVPDVCLIDIMLPDGSGLDALRAVKAKHPKVSVIMLSALGKEEDKVNALNLGADDYIEKPFGIMELVARVNARLRRTSPKNEGASYKDIVVDDTAHTITVAGIELTLTLKQYELLRVFVKNAGKAFTRDELLDEVWGENYGETRTLDIFVSDLRKKLSGSAAEIVTVRGVGYMLK